MDFDLRLKALTGLANSQTHAAVDALKQALQKAQTSLREDTQYDLLEQSLSVLEVIGHRFSDEVTAEIISFIASIKTRQITYSDELSMFASNIATYQNASSLAVRSVEVLLCLRYLATTTITQALLKLSIDEDKDIRSRAIDGLKTITAYDLDVFYGPDRQSDLAIIYILTGEYELALDKLEYLLSIPGSLTSWNLRLNPVYDPLRDNPRFHALVNDEYGE